MTTVDSHADSPTPIGNLRIGLAVVAMAAVEHLVCELGEGDRARGLACIAVLANAGPAVAGDRAGFGDQAGGGAQLVRRNPGDRFDVLWRFNWKDVRGNDSHVER